ncbi:hypothetical protein PHYBOEH_011473 [Phytophthora boehmeriae]|uniref:DUF6604 domain-containing protein n=1 Tax=Phytophthora boehmeriae TaxID=109152 RepID=A0A8T1X168_9STRA|nr:hypothetical protein PHYBOEH_011473 [Phytophthora boehmeriae]
MAFVFFNIGWLPKALEACQCAITLREHVSVFFSDDGGRSSAQTRYNHQYFLNLLKDWHRTLSAVESDTNSAASASTGESRRFGNYYDVLRVDEDYFPDEETFVPEAGAPKSAKADRERLFNEAFAEDLRLEVVYFFLEIEELVEGVFTIYDQVKKQQRTMVEATVVVKLAIDTAKALTARLQLRYPSLKLAEDILLVVMDHAPANFTKRMASAVNNFWQSFYKDATYTFVPGMLLIDFVSVGSTLASFTSAIPTQARTKLVLRDGFFGETYGEERTPQYVLPDHSNMVVFLLQQLPLIYNTILATKVATGSNRYKSSGLAGSFMTLMDEYFTSRKVTVPVVFACICWLKAVAALQGNAGLGRNVSLTFKHSTELMKNMEATVAKKAVLTADKEIHDILKHCASEIKQSSRIHNLARANPLMAGLLMLDYHCQYLHAAGETLMVTSRFRAFGHLYNALVEQGFIQHIPFFDEVLSVYDQMIFTPSRDAAVHGAYNRTYMLSSHMTATSVNAMYRGVTPPAGKGVKVRIALHLRDLSDTFRLITENDKSVLGGASSKAMLSKAADICSKELFETRVLSRDMLKLNDDLTDAFSQMCDDLAQRQYHDDYIARPTAGESRQYRVNRALEDAVMMPLMPLLDALQADGSLDLSTLPAPNRVVQLGRLDGEVVQVMCRKASTVITAKFATPPLICEQKYHLGQISLARKESDGPLSENDLAELKTEIKNDPELLVMVSLATTSSPAFDPNDLSMATRNDLCTLLHQAAAGPAHDASLVEWMIQLGALAIQPTIHCRKEPRQRDLRFSRDLLANTMAVHSAAIAGYEDIVRLILEAENLLDLNTPTYHTKETLAHLAVKHGHRGVYDLIAALGADLRIKDGNGRRVCDVTTDRQWARKIAASIGEIEVSQANCEGARNRDALFRHEGNLRAERLRKSVSAQRDEDRRRAFENANTSSSGAAKKKGKKSKKGKKASAREFYEFTHAIYALPELDGVACFGKRVKHVMYGGNSEDDVARIRDRVLELAAREGVNFAGRSAQPCTETAHVGQFVFSAAGIVRGAATA